MAKKKHIFTRHSDEQQKQYEREIRLEVGPDIVNESIQRWNGYSQAEQAEIMEEMGDIYSDIAEAIEAGKSVNDPDVQTVLERWQANLHHFYTPTLEMLQGLGQMYNSHPDFIANFQKIHPELPSFLEEAIEIYVDELETKELERMLAEDEAFQQRTNRLSL